jgi:hypothetical protein
MNKVVSVLKRYWNKIISVVCALGICAVTVFSMASPAYAVTSWSDVADDAIAVRDAYFTYWFSHKSSFGDFIKQASDIPVSWLKFVDSFGWVISPVDDLYYYLNDSKDLMVAAGGGGGHSRTALHGGGGYCRTCRKPSDECTCEFFESEADGFDPVINGSDLKQIYTDYSLMYAPMPTPSQYLYNYQSATGKKETGYGYHQFNPYAPVFRYGKGYGADVGQASGWSNGCYVLPYIFDDDLQGTYYSWGYWHFYHKTEDNIRYICADYISLADDSDVTHFESAWKMSEKGASYGLATFANYFALCSYNSDTLYLQCSQSTADFSLLQLSLGRDKFLALNGKITDLVSKSFTSFLQASTFTPQTNIADDWGYIMSETPFELFANQTSIDFDKVPNNYIITINGDTIYDYSITNPDSGDSTSIRKFIDIYDFPDVPDLPDPDTPGVNGNITVSGNVGVNGKIEIDTKPIDININVNSNGGSAPSGTAEAVDLSNYFSTLPEQSETMNDYLKNFFSFLPPQLLAVLLGGIGCAVLCRVLGR